MKEGTFEKETELAAEQACQELGNMVRNGAQL